MNLVIEELRELSIPMIDLTGFDKSLILNQDKQQIAKKVLSELFIVPPMSVLNTKRDYWQNRKQLWIDLGLTSGKGREGLKTTGALSGTVPGYYNIKNKKEAELGRKISHKEMEETYLKDFMANTNLMFTETGGLLSIFDPVLCEIIYRWFIPKEGGSLLIHLLEDLFVVLWRNF